MQEELLALRQKYRDGLIPMGEYLAAIDVVLDTPPAPPPPAPAPAPAATGGTK